MKSLRILILAAAALSQVKGFPQGVATKEERDFASPTAEVPHTRQYFYAGGRYADDGSGTGSRIFKEQMYVEQLTPLGGSTKKYPLVMIHGQGQTGTNFLNKPDGGRGWATLFLEQGYEVYVVDQTLRARSPWMPNNWTMATYSVETVQTRFTACQDFNAWPQAKLHTQWPGSGLAGDPVFNAFYASQIQYLTDNVYQETTMQNAGAALLDHIGKPVILLAHSQAGSYPWLIADVRPQLTHAIVGLEPSGPPFQDAVFDTNPGRAYGLADIPLTYDPPVTDPTVDLVKQNYPAPSSDTVSCILQAASPAPRVLKNLAALPILVLTTEASYHSVYDHCTFSYIIQAGCSKAQHIVLPDIGIHGNGHMVFMEKNSDVVQGVVENWLSKLG